MAEDENRSSQDEEMDVQEQENEIQEQMALEERIQDIKDRNSLKKIIKKAPYRFYPHLTKSEKGVVARVKKKHPVEVAKLTQIMLQKKAEFYNKVQSVVAPALPFIGYILLAILIIIILVVIIASIFPWLFPEEGNTNGAASPFGMKGANFYGGRVVYKDETLSRNGLVEQYVDIIETSVDNLQNATLTQTVNVDGEDVVFDVKLIINIALPSEAEQGEISSQTEGENTGYNFEELDLTQFATDYPEIYAMVETIAKVCYKIDNGVDAETGELTAILDGIKYFGFTADMLGSGFDSTEDSIIEIVYNYLYNNNSITLQEKQQSSTTYVDATNVALDDVTSDIQNTLTTTFADVSTVRTEKLFVKDFILNGDDSYLEGIEKKNYVALIYIPKTNYNFDYLSYMITVDPNAEFSMKVFVNGSEIGLSKSDGENWADEDATDLTYTYSSSKNLGKSLDSTTIIDTANLNMLNSNCSLYKLVRLTDEKNSDYNIYLESSAEDSSVLTYKKGSMYVEFTSNTPFMFNEEIG